LTEPPRPEDNEFERALQAALAAEERTHANKWHWEWLNKPVERNGFAVGGGGIA
jgi:hypothetical protein